METNSIPESLSFTEKLPSLPVFCGVPERVGKSMPIDQRTRIYSQWVILNKERLEEPLLYTVKKPLTMEVFEQLIRYIYENIAILLPESWEEISFTDWSTLLEELVMESYCWSLIIPDSLVTHILTEGVTLTEGNDLVN